MPQLCAAARGKESLSRARRPLNRVMNVLYSAGKATRKMPEEVICFVVALDIFFARSRVYWLFCGKSACAVKRERWTELFDAIKC